VSTHLKIIYTGGTLGMQPGHQGLVPASNFTGRLNAALEASPEHKHQLDQVEWSLTESATLLDSANIVPANWEELAGLCLNTKGADGIVIIHGTDTLAYTSSALAYFLQDIKVPIILTGSQKPLGAKKSDALDNLVGAMLEVARAKPGVWVYFHQQLMPGARVVKKDAIGFAGFATPRLTTLPEKAGPCPSINWQQSHRDWSSIQIATTQMVPGYNADHLGALINTRPDAIILSLFGLGTLADQNGALLSALRTAKQKNIVVTAVSQCYIGQIDFSVYSTGAQLALLGVLNGRDLTLEAAYTKLMVLLRMGYPVERVKQLFEQRLANDMSSDHS
jgi:L-asparaginase